MVAPTYTFLGFNYSIQNLPHHRTADFERRKEWSVYYKFRRNLFKHGISFDVTRLARQKLKLSSARTQAPKQSTGLFLFASKLPCSSLLMILYKKERYHKWYLSFLWSGWRGSNSLPQPWQGCALPGELHPQVQVKLYTKYVSLSRLFSKKI